MVWVRAAGACGPCTSPPSPLSRCRGIHYDVASGFKARVWGKVSLTPSILLAWEVPGYCLSVRPPWPIVLIRVDWPHYRRCN